MLHIEQRLALFREMVNCCHAIYLWSYDRDMNLLSHNCPEEEHISHLLNLFSIEKRWETVCDHLCEYQRPIVMSNEMGLMWIAAPELSEKTVAGVHILGPFFIYDGTVAQFEKNLRERKLSMDLWQDAIRFLRSLPVLTVVRVMEYAVMLHYCVNGEKLELTDVHFKDDESYKLPETELEAIHGTYEAEREMLRLVREGDLNYKEHMKVIAGTGKIGNISDGDPVRQLKNMIIVNITLFSRAAMEGGLPPEIAYAISDRYYQAVEKSKAIQAIVEINTTMQEDFIQRVHQCRQNKDLTKPIRVCLEQMRARMEEDITLEGLAKEFGYSPYYLSKKFKKETGQSFKDCLKELRLERAKFLLKNTNTTILEISERLQFCSQSYFADSFRKEYGISPTEYREQLDIK